jgi:hypothetical protein
MKVGHQDAAKAVHMMMTIAVAMATVNVISKIISKEIGDMARIMDTIRVLTMAVHGLQADPRDHTTTMTVEIPEIADMATTRACPAIMKTETVLVDAINMMMSGPVVEIRADPAIIREVNMEPLKGMIATDLGRIIGTQVVSRGATINVDLLNIMMIAARGTREENGEMTEDIQVIAVPNMVRDGQIIREWMMMKITADVLTEVQEIVEVPGIMTMIAAIEGTVINPSRISITNNPKGNYLEKSNSLLFHTDLIDLVDR